jgi:hypothetical protein
MMTGVESRFLDEPVGGEEWVLERVERKDPEQVDHGDAVVHGEAAAGGARRQVRGAEHPLRPGQVRREVLLAPRPVAEGDDVGTASEQLVGELGGDAAARGRVLAVHDAEVGPELLTERGQPCLDGATPRRAEDVGDEEDAQG